ncbi:putative carboxylesterase [Aspergillus fischeri NRRL 181]|uniref:Carboxylic ester hydrolase n=1 Tax=Neosartorya fischeri (strain ATCC 1020 / DSM 3700 / CBS 544.65 / FGSC A1164 / JCM 1740 / NRRL 181 / WB 181) TaxID=331117 RepID=A1D5C6_NEOFI|nr:carboxylesterase family protein [Aspergillus fischeri NRRL 181]EAW23619.1 carboxylesterase family protein [Aspergillus fischeri NRRL 181]
MRYAAPPLGNLRFRAPREPVHNSTLQDASEFGPICVGTGQSATSMRAEDCLFINVFTPSDATKHSKLPVWVFIQGGAYATNSNANYNGTEVVQESGNNIVFVNFNYRVGALGFLAGEEVQRDGDLNVGLLDQREALKWVKKHIRQFGGNPDHVVIHGASAGGGSVSFHLTAYGGRNDDLFVGAIPESPWWAPQVTISESEVLYHRLLQAVGCSTLACLRSVDASAVQKANLNAPDQSSISYPAGLGKFWPVIDGDLVRDRLYASFEKGKFIRVPLMVSSDTDEGSSFAYNATSPAEVSLFLRSFYPHLNSEQLQAINDAYPKMDPVSRHAAYFPSASAAFGDATIVCPGIHITSSMARFLKGGSDKVWNYRYNVQDPPRIAAGLGVTHTFDLQAIFGLNYGSSVSSSMRDINAPIIPVVMYYYISFIRTLNPNLLKADSAPFWKPWGDGERLKIQTNATAMETISDVQRDRCNLWKRLAPVLEV